MDKPSRRDERAGRTRQALVDVASRHFAEQGYADTSMRDIERDGPVTMAAIYAHFRNKAALLVEAVNQRIVEDLEQHPQLSASTDLVERLTAAARHSDQRRALRSLLVQAAAASLTDDDTRVAVGAAQSAHLDTWVAAYRANETDLGIDPSIDVDTFVRFTWAVELGLGVLEAFDIGPASPEDWATIQRRLAQAIIDTEET